MKLQKKILLSNLILFVLPCLFLVWLMVSLVRQEGNERLNQSRLVILNQINENMEDIFFNIITFSDFFYNNPKVNRLLSQRNFKDAYESVKVDKQIREYIRERWMFYGENGYFAEFLGENGHNYSSQENENMNFVYSELKKLKEEPWYPEIMKTSKIHYISVNNSAEFAKNPESAVRAVRRLINFNSGRTIGLMDISIQKSRLHELLDTGTKSPFRNVFLIDHKGYIICDANEEETGKTFRDADCLQKLQNYEHGYFQDWVDGVLQQVCFVTNPTTGWKVVMCENVRTGDWFTNQYLGILMVTLIFLVLAFFMSWYNAHYISRPVQKLKNHMRTVYQGDLSVRAEVETDDEFGQLSLQFNEMINQIQSLIQQLEKKDEEKRVLELQALQAQINPHFLYNTLASIRFLMEMGKQEKAQQSLLALVKFLKSTFSEHRKLIPVWEELEVLFHYLVLMENRCPDSFVWDIHMDPEIQDCLVPRFSIQPLVENSISHGFGEKREVGHIRIEASRNNMDLVIRILDDGVGADLEKIDRLLNDTSPVGGKEKLKSIGIRNVQQRLRLFFGESYGLTVHALADGGVCFQIRVPVKTEEN
ncbi:MAG: sensor histidine kinase [Lachnospiraceae bacterium]|nr:sensor histidine kinase [Lachnospiraceae bacterium]